MWHYQHQNFTVHQIPALKDNYIYLIEAGSAVAVVDPAAAEPVIAACKQLGLTPTHVLNTHHHWDHTDGNKKLRERFDCEVIGFEGDSERIPAITTTVENGETFSLGELSIDTLFVPGHTSGHIAFVIKDALFCGDTLFGGGCGRLFEGTPEQMWESLQKLAALPAETKVYCAHEYTLPNLRFARDIDQGNEELSERISRDTQTRMQQMPTIPSTIGLECATNPFLRPLSDDFCKQYAEQAGSPPAPVEVFAHIRASKDRW